MSNAEKAGAGTEVVVVLCTCPPDRAEALARDLVESRRAACVNIIESVRSIYRWEGKVCDDGESLLVIKTARDRVAALERRLVEIHPYSVPEVIALPVTSGHDPYLRWVLGETAACGDGDPRHGGEERQGERGEQE